jgi:endonuclease/exonuclease/phosphatase family metal-dependent hydrolase
MTGLLTLLVGLHHKSVEQDPPNQKLRLSPTGVVLLTLVWLGTLGTALKSSRVETVPPSAGSLKVMTYNIQQANDAFGERSFQEQLALIQEENPDILALQESDSARVSLNNNDYVRYYTGKLGYYSYFGPKTVSGTYGTAILSKYPLQNKRTIFSFSDQDEIGTAAAEVVIGGETFTVYNVHPAGSDTAMNAFAETILERSKGIDRVIILGDFNLRDYEGAYQLFANRYTNAWESVYPSKISPDGIDMSGENRIDHIFISPDLEVRDPKYLLPPESATDHPVHWAEIIWKDN